MDIVNKIWSKYLGVNTTDAVLAKEAASEIESLRANLAAFTDRELHLGTALQEALQVVEELLLLLHKTPPDSIENHNPPGSFAE